MGNLAEGLDELQNEWGELKLYLRNSYVSRSDTMWWLCCTGEFVKRKRASELWDHHVEQLRKVLYSNLSQEVRLFLIQRNIASCLREVASGWDDHYLCRFEATLFKEKRAWKLANAHLFFSYHWIVKGRFL